MTRYEYNRNNALTKITYPQGTVVAYQRDAIGNIASVALNGETIAAGFSYEPFGEFKTMNFSAGNIQTTVSRDTKYQIKGIQAGRVVNRTYSS